MPRYSADALDRVEQALRAWGPMSRSMLATRTGYHETTLQHVLRALVQSGRVRRTQRACYRRPSRYEVHDAR